MVFTEGDRTLLARGFIATQTAGRPPSHRSVIIRWDTASAKQLSAVEFQTLQSFEAILAGRPARCNH